MFATCIYYDTIQTRGSSLPPSATAAPPGPGTRNFSSKEPYTDTRDTRDSTRGPYPSRTIPASGGPPRERGERGDRGYGEGDNSGQYTDGPQRREREREPYSDRQKPPYNKYTNTITSSTGDNYDRSGMAQRKSESTADEKPWVRAPLPSSTFSKTAPKSGSSAALLSILQPDRSTTTTSSTTVDPAKPFSSLFGTATTTTTGKPERVEADVNGDDDEGSDDNIDPPHSQQQSQYRQQSQQVYNKKKMLYNPSDGQYIQASTATSTTDLNLPNTHTNTYDKSYRSNNSSNKNTFIDDSVTYTNNTTNNKYTNNNKSNITNIIRNTRYSQDSQNVPVVEKKWTRGLILPDTPPSTTSNIHTSNLNSSISKGGKCKKYSSNVDDEGIESLPDDEEEEGQNYDPFVYNLYTYVYAIYCILYRPP